MSENERVGEEKPLREQVEKTRTRQKSYVMDLRIHSPASREYVGVEGIDSAPAIVRLAKVKGLDMIAVTDYYTGEFIDRVVSAARDSSVTVIPGVDVRCKLGVCDDVILTCLFPESCNAEEVKRFLRDIGVPESARGNRHYLVHTPFELILAAVEKFGGVALPSRMDKTPHRMSALSTLIERYGFRAFDLAYADSSAMFKTRWPKLKFHLFSFSDANALAQVGSRIAKVKMAHPGFAGVREIVARERVEMP